MAKTIKIRRGLNIPLVGQAEKILIRAEKSETYAVKPTDFQGIVPKLCVEIGTHVQAGTALFCDKNRERIVFTSPVSGEVVDIVRGERRALLRVVVKADDEIDYKHFGQHDLNTLDDKQIIDTLLQSGVWACIKQRPFGVVAEPEIKPRDIFISCFDTAPLAADIDFTIQSEEKNFQTGIDVLRKLTSGKIHLGINAEYPESKLLSHIRHVEKHYFSGPHPAGNVGVQISRINPINKGDTVWTLSPQAIIIVGKLFLNGIYDASRIVCTAGSEVAKPRYYRTIQGVGVSCMLNKTLVKSERKQRVISGNVLTGQQIDTDGYLGFFDNLVTVIPEGDNYEFLGWMKPGLKKFTASRTMLSKLKIGHRFNLDTNYHGEERAYVVNGQYEKVMPIDIYPVYLIKAIMANDIDRMEQLGIYEVIEEDMALCEFVCTSKIEVQSILRQGINAIMAETT